MTEKLEYKIGKLDIDPRYKNFIKPHKFIVGASDNTLSIYIADETYHKNIVEKFKIQFPVGGGILHSTGRERLLVLDDSSASYGPIPRQATKKFLEVLSPTLKELGFQVGEVRALTNDKCPINSYWKEKGFDVSTHYKS